MNKALTRALPVLALFTATVAQAQFYKLHGASVSFGATENFSTPLTSNASSGNFNIATPTGGVLNETVSNQQQYTTNSAGFLASLQFHPVAFAGVEVNYGFTHYSEDYAFNYSSATAPQQVSVSTFQHEATAAYVFHPRHIPFQPFVNIGGGGIDFLPKFANNQWRGTGLVEAGFDVPTPSKHLALRIQGRALIYRAPNFNNAILSTRRWRSQEEPGASFVYRF